MKKVSSPMAILWMLACLLTTYAPPTLHAGILPDGFAELRLAEGLDGTTVTYSPDGRLFVTQKKGIINIIKNGVMLPLPFMDLQAQVDNRNERGLQNLVFDPNFATNGYVYLYYCAAGQSRNRVTRITANGDVALPGSEVVILNLDILSGAIHNGGSMFFKDDKLFVATGDGSNANQSQSFSSLLGKVLRLNADGSIPTDNPYYSTLSGNARMIYALGFRNPYRAAVQPGTGKVFINDVGGSQWEEINELASGKNYGWPLVEGRIATQTPPTNYQDPFYTYSHSNGCSIGGGAFYNPATSTFPSKYIGKYFFSDYCGNYIKVLDPSTGVILETFATGINRPISFTVAADGSFYYLARGGLTEGSDDANTQSCCSEVWKIQFTGNGIPTISAQPANQQLPIGGTATFAVGGSGNAPLTFQWQRNGVDIPGANSFIYRINAVTGADHGVTFRARLTNALGSVTSQNAVLTVTDNLPPQPIITLPTEAFNYTAGTILTFAGTATDAEDGILPSSSFLWEINFHHGVHTHPAMPPTSGITGGTFALEDNHDPASNVWYRIYLTVTDSRGQAATTFRDIHPILSNVTLTTPQPGLKLLLDGSEVTSPFSFTGVAGIHRHIEAPASQILEGETYEFVRWSDGGARGHQIVTPSSNQTLSASYIPMLMEAEAATLSGVEVRVTYTGYTGSGYGDFIGNTGTFIEWTANVPAGNYKIDFRYANGGRKNRPLQLMVNGSVIEGAKDFLPTGGWMNWNVVSSNVTLQQGNNTIRITTTGANGGIIDHVVVRKATTQIPTVSSPVITPAAGTYATAQTITVVTATAGAVIYYTLDGSTPTTSSPVYSTPLVIANTQTIKTFAVKSGMNNSPIITAAYVIGANPGFSVQLEAENAVLQGAIIKNNFVGFTGTGFVDYRRTGNYIEWTVNAPTQGSYTLAFRYANGGTKDRPLEIKVNGLIVEASKSFPSTTLWTTWMEQTSTVTLNAGINLIRTTVAGTDGCNMDHLIVRQGGSTTPIVSPPIFTPPAGTYADTQTVSITSTAGATIFYTTDGSTPNASSPLYSTPLIVPVTTTVKAIATKAGATNSSVSTAAYIIIPSYSEILETEDAVRSGVAIKFNYVGYTGIGFGNYAQDAGDYIEWTALVPASGSYNLDFRYSLRTGNRPLEIKVNGIILAPSKSFPATGSWTTWGVVNETATLNAGNNLIRLTSIGSNAGNIDHLKVSSVINLNASTRVASAKEIEVETEEEVSVHPVPANNVLTIKSRNPVQLLNMVSMNGITIQPPHTQISDTEIEVQLTTIASGTYMMIMRSQNRYIRKKIVIKK